MEALPENLSELTDDALAELESTLLTGFDDLRAGEHTPEAVAEMTQTVEAIESVRAEAERRITAEADRTALVDELLTRIEASTEEPPADPDAAPPAEGDDDAEGDDTEGDAAPPEAEVDERVPVTASARRRAPLGSVRKSAPVPAIRPSQNLVITAAADIPGVPTGSRFGGIREVREAMHKRARGLSDGQGAAVVYPIASFSKDIPEDQWLRGVPADAEVIARFANGVDFDALVASGGFCGPLEPLYDICSNFDTDGLLDLPTVGVSRSGIQVPTPLVFPTDLSTVVWNWTNADDIAADPGDPLTHKPCVTVPCPVWEDHILEAWGICVTAGNLADRSFPEGTTAYVEMVLAAQLHAANMAKQLKIKTGSTAVAGKDYGGAAGSITTNVEEQAEVMRYVNRMSLSQSIDVNLPAWARGAMRGDLANRAGVVALNISDAEINGWFSDRNLRVQWLQDHPQAAPTTGYPATVEAGMYPSGAWIEGDGGTLDLGVTRDSTLNATNDHTAAWAESFSLVAQVCEPSIWLTIPGIAADGVTACCP